MITLAMFWHCSTFTLWFSEVLKPFISHFSLCWKIITFRNSNATVYSSLLTEAGFCSSGLLELRRMWWKWLLLLSLVQYQWTGSWMECHSEAWYFVANASAFKSLKGSDWYLQNPLIAVFPRWENYINLISVRPVQWSMLGLAQRLAVFPLLT